MVADRVRSAADPYDYISPQDIARTADLKSRWDVLIFPPGGGNALAVIEGMPMWGRDPGSVEELHPTRRTLERIAQTDDIRPGLTWQGLITLQNFVRQGGVFHRRDNSTELPLSYGLTRGVVDESHSIHATVKEFAAAYAACQTRRARSTYGVADNLAVFSNDGQSFTVSVEARWTRSRRGSWSAAGADDRHRAAADDQEVIQGPPDLSAEPAGGG